MSASILFVIGTRPEAIKTAPVLRALGTLRDGPAVRVCVTSQHREMLAQVLEFFEIRPDADLDLMSAGQDLVDFAARALAAIRSMLHDEEPSILVVHGDTTTALAGCLAGYYNRTWTAHVEAGLRTGRLHEPYPEEMNRCVIDRLAHRLYAPTDGARANLLGEGLDPAKIAVTGNTGIDALFFVRDRIRDEPDLVSRPVRSLADSLRPDGPVILVTAHRRENFGAPLTRICSALTTVLRDRPDASVVFPVHLNPNVNGPVRHLMDRIPAAHLLDPLSYPDLVFLMQRADIVVTDSGGLQEEAPALGKPVVVTRDYTERPELMESGAGVLAGTSEEKIVESIRRFIEDEGFHREAAVPRFLFGDGHAGQRIAEDLAHHAAGSGIEFST